MNSMYTGHQVLLSKEARQLLSNKIGYRTNNAFEDGVTDLLSIIAYEIYDLGNTDILITLQDLYGFEVDWETFESSDLGCIQVIEQTKQFCQSLIDDLNPTGMWLYANEFDVEEYYGNNLQSYEVPDMAFVISDLGREGILIGHK